MRPLATIRATYGVFLLVMSDIVVKRITTERSRMGVTVGRVLGLRHVMQALALNQTRSGSLLTVGVVMDVLHALSMTVVAVRSDKYRRLATLDAIVAGLWATIGWLSRRDG